MKTFKRSALVLAVSASAALVGCGGSGGSGGAASNDSQTVTAIDGYLFNADVYIDANQNGSLDPSEASLGPVGSTNENGQITVVGETFNGALLVKAVAGKTVDSDSGVVDQDFILGAPAASKYVTPFTHIRAKTGESADELAKRLELDVSLLTGDYIKSKNGALAEQAKVAHALARFIVAEVKKAPDSEKTVSSYLGDAKTKIESLIDSGVDADLVEVELDDSGSGAINEAPTTKLAFSKSELTQAPNWTMFRFDDAGDNEQFYIRFGNANRPNDAFCMNNEALEGVNGESLEPIAEPDNACTAEADFDVNSDGKLVLDWANDDGTSTSMDYTMLYRHSETIAGQDGEQDFDYRVFLMVANNGELFWVDNNPVIMDAGDYVIEEDVTKFVFQDDDGDRGVIDYIVGQATFEVVESVKYTVSGSEQELNTGSVTLSDVGSTEGGKTAFKTVPRYEMENWEPSNDDTLITVEEASADNHEHWLFDYRTAGALSLVLDYKAKDQSENLYLESESQALIERIAKEVKSRNSGTQGDF